MHKYLFVNYLCVYCLKSWAELESIYLELSSLKKLDLSVISMTISACMMFLFSFPLNQIKLDQIYYCTGQLSQYSWHPYLVIDKGIDVLLTEVHVIYPSKGHPH